MSKLTISSLFCFQTCYFKNAIYWINIKRTMSMDLLIRILFARMNAPLWAADRATTYVYNMPMAASVRERITL